MNTAEELIEEGRDAGLAEGQVIGWRKACAHLRKLRESGASISDACLDFERQIGAMGSKPAGSNSEAASGIAGTLESIAAIKAGKANPGDLAAQTVEIMRARRAGTYEAPIERVEFLRRVQARDTRIVATVRKETS